jgi:hypothetical protein
VSCLGHGPYPAHRSLGLPFYPQDLGISGLGQNQARREAPQRLGLLVQLLRYLAENSSDLFTGSSVRRWTSREVRALALPACAPSRARPACA